MILKLFDLTDDTSNPRSGTAREREVQAYYEEHANAATKVNVLKWMVAALLVFVGFAAWAGGKVNAGEPNDRSKPAIAADDAVSQNPRGSPVTVFIDGPTGFVFVYTAEGWKFVRSMGPGKL